MRRHVASGLTLVISLIAAAALFLSVSELTNRAAVNRRLIVLERPTQHELNRRIATALRTCSRTAACRRRLLTIVEHGAREELRRRKRQAQRRESSASHASRGASRAPSGSRVESGTRRSPRRRTPQNRSGPSPARRPAPSSPSPTSPPASKPPVGVTVDPAHVPTVCTPLVGVNC